MGGQGHVGGDTPTCPAIKLCPSYLYCESNASSIEEPLISDARRDRHLSSLRSKFYMHWYC